MDGESSSSAASTPQPAKTKSAPIDLRPLPTASGGPLVIAHRGASGRAPENTHSAYQLAIDMRSDMIEIDLHLTKDGRIAITHDAELEEIGGEGEVADHDFAALQQLDAGGGERIPELGDVLDRFGGSIPFNLEIKVSSVGPYEGLQAAAMEEVKARGLLRSVLFSSFDDDVLAELRALESQVRLGVLASWKRPGGLLERARAVAAEAVNPYYGHAGGPFVAEAHAAGFAVYPYTADDPGAIRQLVEARVDGLFTNHPDRMLRLLGR